MSVRPGSALHLFLGAALLAIAGSAAGHGGVVLEDDVCVIRIGYLEAHFKIYLPQTHGHREFCEDLPKTAETVFVMEYSHRDLAQTPIDFRIVHNTTGLGRFAGSEDLEQLDLDTLTVFHQEATIEPDVYTIIHEFEDSGEYIGIVQARHPHTGRIYSAVFPFSVGFAGFGFWPWLAGFAAFLFGNLWLLRRRMTA
jgi:hypothetical protein